jgi:galactokinase
VDELHARLVAAFIDQFGCPPDFMTRAPGRVNLIGEHTDYNDGFVLPMAISCQTLVAVRARKDNLLRIFAVDLGGSLSSFLADETVKPDPDTPWSNYVRGVAHGLYEAGVTPVGADIAIAGDIPRGAGLSSSASLEMACGLAMAILGGQPDFDRTALALVGQRAERDFAGCNCGVMDQVVSAQAVRGHAILLDCRSLAITPIAMPDGVSVMIVHSGIERGLVDGAYNERRMQCEAAAQHYRVPALRDLTLAALEHGRAQLDEVVYRRARHVVTENDRVHRAAEALQRGDLSTLGALMAQSHVSMRDDFEITLPAIDELVARLQGAIGELGGARMTGGGFGGAVVAVMPSAKTDEVLTIISADYRTPEGKPPHIRIEKAAAGACLMRGDALA